MTDKSRALLLGVREALIIALRAIEDYLEMPRTVESKRRQQT